MKRDDGLDEESGAELGEEGALSPAERAFETFLARRDTGGGFEIEELCARHPELAPELRALQQA